MYVQFLKELCVDEFVDVQRKWGEKVHRPWEDSNLQPFG